MAAAKQFQFNQVVFFGRSIEEYVAMFDLDLSSMQGKRVLDCCAGPAAFASQAAAYGIKVTACDPLYECDDAHLREIVDHDSASVWEKQKRAPDLFYKEVVQVPERRKAMEVFLQDYAEGKKAGRYVAGSLPQLPFANQEFEIVLSGNLLFIYSDTGSGGMLEDSPFDYAFHLDAVKELLRVSGSEVRIYPLQGPAVQKHAYLEPMMQELSQLGYSSDLVPVSQRDIIGAEHLLHITRAKQLPNNS